MFKMHDPRSLIIRALLLDGAGQLLILCVILWMSPLIGWPIGGSNLDGQGSWLLFSFLLYPFLGWLFGSYTVLRWRRLALPVLLQRLVITAAVSVMVVAVARWLINPDDSVWLVYRSVQLLWMLALTGWALLVRLALRRGLLLPESPRLLLLAQQNEIPTVLAAWQRGRTGYPLVDAGMRELWAAGRMQCAQRGKSSPPPRGCAVRAGPPR